MIPVFPHFKKLELPDKKNVEKFTSQFPPYSDFNFVSMWVWNIKNTMNIAQLNGNLVVLFTDYVSGDSFLSFVGNKKIQETATELILYSKQHLQKDYLKLIPEEIALSFKSKDVSFSVKTDRDSYDYVYLSEHLEEMPLWKKNSCTESLKKFLKKYPEYTVKENSIQSIDKEEYRKLFHIWSQEKHFNNAYDLNEYKAFQRFLDLKYKNLLFVSIYLKGMLAGFSAYEILTNGYAMAHFSKGDVKDYPGIYNLLNWEEARVFHRKGVRFLNWEQDLGIAGIRYSKEKYKPYFLMKKLLVSLV